MPLNYQSICIFIPDKLRQQLSGQDISFYSRNQTKRLRRVQDNKVLLIFRIHVASSPLTMLIHWPYYCIVHVYIVIHFCDSMFFWVDVNLCTFFLIVWLYLYCYWRHTCLTPTPSLPHICARPEPGPGLMHISPFFVFNGLRCRWFVRFVDINVIFFVDLLLLKLSFHNINIINHNKSYN